MQGQDWRCCMYCQAGWRCLQVCLTLDLNINLDYMILIKTFWVRLSETQSFMLSEAWSPHCKLLFQTWWLMGFWSVCLVSWYLEVTNDAVPVSFLRLLSCDYLYEVCAGISAMLAKDRLQIYIMWIGHLPFSPTSIFVSRPACIL